MIIQAILIAGLLLCIAYAFFQRGRSAWISAVIAATATVGIYFVLNPGQTTDIATFVGVGRGADLVLYCWIVISLVVSINLHFRMIGLQASITELTRELALRDPAAATAIEA